MLLVVQSNYQSHMQDLLGRGYMNPYYEAQAEGRWKKRKVFPPHAEKGFKNYTSQTVLCSLEDVQNIIEEMANTTHLVLFFPKNT